jgi:hypothetical protein
MRRKTEKVILWKKFFYEKKIELGFFYIFFAQIQNIIPFRAMIGKT